MPLQNSPLLRWPPPSFIIRSSLRYFQVPRRPTKFIPQIQSHVSYSNPSNRISLNFSDIQVIDALLAYAGISQRQEELFTSSDLFSRARSGFKGLKGVENVYTQHSPFLERTLSTLTKGRLRDQTHPFIGTFR